MPELPDITIYLEAIEQRVKGKRLEKLRILNPFVLRTFEPPPEAIVRREVVALRRLGKRIAIGFDGEYWLVIHLMIAGRLHWKAKGAKLGGKYNLAALDFAEGSLVLTEAGAKRRAAMHVVQGEAALVAHDPGGLEVISSSPEQFAAALRQHNHTLKRALTDPHILSGIGNAYSDEILHRAKLSPLLLTKKLSDEDYATLHAATQAVLQQWIERLRVETKGAFPEKLTAFHAAMAVHGRFGQSCPVCGSPVQRIRLKDNETNYCARCQTAGKILADRSLSRLLKDDWPRHLDEL